MVSPASMVLPAVTLLALAARLYHLDFQSLWRDEVDVLRFSTESLPALSRRFLTPGENGPLYYLFHHYWLAAFGGSELALRLPSALFGTAAVPAIYGLGKLLLDAKAARLAALIAALSPFYVWYSQDAKMYPLLLLLTCLSLYLYLRALCGGGVVVWAAYVVVASLGLYVHFFSALVLLAEAILYFLFFRGRSPFSWTVSMGLLTLPYFPLAVWEIPTLLSPPATAYPSFSLQGVATILLVLFVKGFGPIPALPSLILALFLLVAAVALYRGGGAPGDGSTENTEDLDRNVAAVGRREKSVEEDSTEPDRRGIPILFALLSVPLVAFALLSLRMPLFTDRYLIVITPAFYLLVASGLTGLHRHHRPAFWVALTLWLGISLTSLAWQSRVLLKADFRSAAASFAALAGPNDLVIFNMPYLRHTFQYYYRGPLQVLEAPYANSDQTALEIARTLEGRVQGRQVVWLVSSEEHLWDARGLVRQWLQANLVPGEVSAYPGVRVERYLLPRLGGERRPGPGAGPPFP